MKYLLLFTVGLLLFALLIPLFAGAAALPLTFPSPSVSATSSPSPTSEDAVETGVTLIPSGSPDQENTVLVWNGETTQEMTMETYLQGVVAAEMPAAFALEALKAQAVAARTFTLYRQSGAAMEEHHGADVCTDSTHCKAYLSPQEASSLWGDQTEAYTEKIAQAVSETDGVAMYYDGSPILSVFHSTSSGRTEAAVDVWTQNLPYLQSVDSPGEEASPRYHGQVSYSLDEFKTLFTDAYSNADFSEDASSWFGTPERSEGGSVTAISVGGVTVSGQEMRQLCGLQSANFTITVEGETILFQTLGYGHGVGMSQYGAQAMALEGASYEEILRHYYTGVSIRKES